MRRRSLLASVPLALAGCLDGGGASDGTPTTDSTATSTDSPTTTARPTTAADPSLVESEFRATDRCPAAGEADVDVGDGTVTVRGCVVGANGCAVATLEAVIFDTSDEALTVVVATADRSGEGEACTQALVELGYRVRTTFEGGLPASVTVVHEDVDGRRTVADLTLGGTTTTDPIGGTTGAPTADRETDDPHPTTVVDRTTTSSSNLSPESSDAT